MPRLNAFNFGSIGLRLLSSAPVIVLSSVEYLVVAGGGGGGSDNRTSGHYNGGGGGAGGMLTGTLAVATGISYTVTIGGGGAGSSSTSGSPGSNSVFSSITSTGGGYGGNKCATQTGKVRAQQLANGESISLATIKRMHSYLSRAETYYDNADDTSDCGYISYLLWGGKAALSWSRNKLRELGQLD